MLPPEFGAALAVARERAGLGTRRALSEALAAAGVAVDPRTLAAWEAGAREPGPTFVIRVLEQVVRLPEGALLVRLSGRSRDPKAFDLRRLLRPERLNYVTTGIRQHVQVGPDGRVESIETFQRIRALFSGVDTCVFAYADEDGERIKVTALSECDTDEWWPRIQGVRQVRIGLHGDPLCSGDEREFAYRTEYRYVGPDHVPATPAELRHLGNGTPTLELFEMDVTFARPGCTVRRCMWLKRGAPPLVQRVWNLTGTESPVMTWPMPRELAYGATWAVPAV